MAKANKEPDTIAAHVRIQRQDMLALQKMAKVSGVTWQMELRMLVHRALRGERREVMVLKDD